MQREGQVEFIDLHPGGATACAFHPKDRYLFVSGGNDKKVQVSNVVQKKQLQTIPLTVKPLNALTFTSDGAKILATCSSRGFSIIDIEKGDTICYYENCASPAPGRQPLANHPDNPNLAACATVNGRGITLLDFRMPVPFDVVYDVHDAAIGDLVFLEGSWPWGSGLVTLLTGGADSLLKVVNLNGSTLHTFPTVTNVSALAPSPGRYNACDNQGYPSVIIAAGDLISCQEATGILGGIHMETFKSFGGKVTRAKFSCGGGLLYTSTQGGSIARYRRYPGHHKSLGHMFTYKFPLNDFAISSYDEYLVAASQDGSVGMLQLGSPSHGWTQYCELT